jgi:PIN domain nuclease of toxin-antitoxin system
MKYLLDTHVLIWAMAAPDKLSARVRAVLLNGGSSLYVSIATPWEMAIKVNSGGLDVGDLLLDFDQRIGTNGYRLLETSTQHAIRAGLLPLHHRDPFDRLLAAQALEPGWTLLSKDAVFDAYGVRRLWN